MKTSTDLVSVAHGMKAADYHATDACSASKLKSLRRSPAHCRYQMDHPPTSDAMALGTLLHSMVLEPDGLLERYALMPKCDKRTTIGKNEWAAAEKAAIGKTIIKADDFYLAQEMAVSCAAHPAYSKLFSAKGHNELSIFWRDEPTDLDCKMRADRVVEVPGFGLVAVDLKTTADASARAFAGSVHKFGYAIQAAMYLDGLALAGIPCEKFVVFAVESAPPHCVAVYALDDESVEQGRKDCRRLMKQYSECVKTGEWPGYSDRIESLSLPVYAFDDDEI